MSSVKDIWGHRRPARSYSHKSGWVLPEEFIGVEFEYEMVNLGRTQTKFDYSPWWTAHEDGSLRDMGVEFTLSEPLFGKDLEDALNIMGEMSNDQKYTTGYRTSVHVHLDVRDLSVKEIHKLCLFYTVFERALFRFIGSNREQSNFCIPWYRSNAYFKYIAALNDPNPDREKIRNYFSGLGRYSALNLDAIKQYGSLEFRGMHGTTDMNKVKHWINLIMCLKKAVRSFPHEGYEILTYLSNVGPDKFVSDIFGDKLYGHVENREIWQGVIEAQNLLTGAVDMDFISPATRHATLKDAGPIIKKYLENSDKKAKVVLPSLAAKFDDAE